MLNHICALLLCLCGGAVGILMGFSMNVVPEFFVDGVLIMGFACVVYAIDSSTYSLRCLSATRRCFAHFL